MIFLSAQPDDFYFTWQLEIQIYNFLELGINPDQIHVLVGYDPNVGLQFHFIELFERLNGKANFFKYPDTRVNSQYESSIRPHLIKQHLLVFPILQNDIIFYHDSDIIFRELPDFSKMIDGDVWFFSDTKSYLSSEYIRSFSQKLFEEMCAVVEVNCDKVIAQDFNCGGAQYLLKKTNFDFWNKVEDDSELLYKKMNDYNDSLIYFANKEVNKIQSWCADMWALLWNIIYFNKEAEVTNELDFCWATSPIELWFNRKILHYTGTFKDGSEEYFVKHRYTAYEPFYDPALLKIPQSSASYPLVQLIIRNFQGRMHKNVNKIEGVVFVIFNTNETASVENLKTLLRYIKKYLNVFLHVVELGQEQVFYEKDDLVKYRYSYFESSKNIDLLKLFNESYSEISKIGIIHADYFHDISQYGDSLDYLETFDYVIPNNKVLCKVNNHFQSIFDKCIEKELLNKNNGKFNTYTNGKIHAIFFIRKEFLTILSYHVWEKKTLLGEINNFKILDHPIYFFHH